LANNALTANTKCERDDAAFIAVACTLRRASPESSAARVSAASATARSVTFWM
jgi:hypothetical protein